MYGVERNLLHKQMLAGGFNLNLSTPEASPFGQVRCQSKTSLVRFIKPAAEALIVRTSRASHVDHRKQQQQR